MFVASGVGELSGNDVVASGVGELSGNDVVAAAVAVVAVAGVSVITVCVVCQHQGHLRNIVSSTVRRFRCGR